MKHYEFDGGYPTKTHRAIIDANHMIKQLLGPKWELRTEMSVAKRIDDGITKLSVCWEVEAHQTTESAKIVCTTRSRDPSDRLKDVIARFCDGLIEHVGKERR